MTVKDKMYRAYNTKKGEYCYKYYRTKGAATCSYGKGKEGWETHEFEIVPVNRQKPSLEECLRTAGVDTSKLDEITWIVLRSAMK